jgi:hypothetical protein
MSDLYREKSTLLRKRIISKTQEGTPSKGRVIWADRWGARPSGLTNQVQARGSYLHRL